MDTEGYKTKSLNVASFLFASGLKLKNTIRAKSEVFFVFTPKNEAEKLMEKYFAGTATIDPRELFARLNDLRDIIFSEGSKL